MAPSAIAPYSYGILEKVLVDGGFITAADMRYHFFVMDHLGNVRVVVNDAGVVEQVNQFYPYGESIELDPASANPAVETITENPYKWSGKEWDEEQGAYDFSARMYSASDARWTTMDPLCEKYYSISPYAYCAGNPVNLVDPDGRNGYRVNSKGEITYVDDKGGDEVDYLYSTDENGNVDKHNKVQVRDTSLVRSLQSINDKGAFSSTSSNEKELKKLFLFLSNNTSVEWIMHFGESVVTLGTIHDNGSAGNWSWYGLSEIPKQSIHSHPNTVKDDELYSMKIDYWHVTSGITAPIFYVYFPVTKAVWQLFREERTYRYDNAVANILNDMFETQRKGKAKKSRRR